MAPHRSIVVLITRDQVQAQYEANNAAPPPIRINGQTWAKYAIVQQQQSNNISFAIDRRVGRLIWPMCLSQVEEEVNVNETMMISEYGWAATLLIIYEDRNWKNIIYQQSSTWAFRKHHQVGSIWSPVNDQRSTGKEENYFSLTVKEIFHPGNEMQKELHSWIGLRLIVSFSISNILLSCLLDIHCHLVYHNTSHLSSTVCWTGKAI